MANLMTELILKHGNTPLPDLVFHHLTKNYLSKKDCLALVFSGATRRYAELFGSNRKLIISRFHHITLNEWNRFIGNITPLAVTAFDASHCYWLPGDTLCDAIVHMSNLEELFVHDTKISLRHLLQIFQACEKIRKLSFSLVESNLDSYQKSIIGRKSLQSIKFGFGRLTHLKIFPMSRNDNSPIDFWPVVFGLLRWCRDCIDLHIEPAYHDQIPDDYEAHSQEVLMLIRNYISANKPHLRWMSFLKSFVFISRGFSSREFDDPIDPIVADLRSMVLEAQQLPRSGIERLWIEDALDDIQFDGLRQLYDKPLVAVKSLLMWEGDDDIDYQNPNPEMAEKFKQMEHFNNFQFSALAHMPALKYVQGTCAVPEGFSNFCKHHPNLEDLRFTNNYYVNGNFQGSTGYGDWALPRLKTIVYRSRRHSAVVMRNLAKKCVNIDELHLVNSTYPNSQNDFLSEIRFHQLKMLSFRRIEIPFGSPDLVRVFEQCPALERLHMIAKLNSLNSPLMTVDFGTCIKAATKLRELRIECWDAFLGIEANIVMLFESLVKFAPKLERLVLDCYCPLTDDIFWESQTDLGQQLIEFMSKMKCLVAFSFTGYTIQPDVQEAVHGHVDAEILPDRPSFWYHLGKSLPKANDPDVPRIHYDEIVYPIDPYYALPKFE